MDTCTVCNETAGTCSRHLAYGHWLATYATDDVEALKADLREGRMDFSLFEMAS